MEASTKEKNEQASSENGDEKRNVGRIEEIQGVVIEAVFPDKLPEVNFAIIVERESSQGAEEDENQNNDQDRSE